MLPSTVIVLAAGAGKRMGGPKALMNVNGKPWWTLQRNRLKEIDIEQVWVFSSVVRTTIEKSPDAPSLIAQVDSSKPMFAAIAAGLDLIEPGHTSGIFILPIDVPVPDAAVWQALAETDRCAVPVHHGARGHPIFMPSGWVDSHLRPARNNPDARLDLLVREDLFTVEVNDPDIAFNLNTPAELDRWISDTEAPN